MDKKQLKLSIIIPCYNSENTIEQVVGDVESKLKDLYDYQFILVNDNSKDDVWKVINRICSENKRVIGLSLAQNYGQQAARMAACPYVSGDYIVFMDDDGQHPPDGIRKMIEKAEEGYDIVYALFKNKKESSFKKFGSWLNTKMTDFIMKKPKDVKQSSYFVVKKFVIEELRQYTSPFPYLFGFFMQITKNIANVELEHRDRISGSSGYTLRKLISLWMNGFLGFSVAPLRIASGLGFICAGIGFVSGCFAVLRKIINPAVATGYTSLIAVILFCSGIIMLMLGLIGEYLGRVFITLNRIPQYVVREAVNVDVDKKNI